MTHDTSYQKIDVHAHAFPPQFIKALAKNPPRPLDIRSNWERDESRFLGEMCLGSGLIFAIQ